MGNAITHVRRSRTMNCPYVRAIAYFDRYVALLPFSADGSQRLIRLRAPLVELGLGGGLALDRDVVASFENSSGGRGLEQAKDIQWLPLGGGPFPSFRGIMSVSASTPKQSILALDGVYEPPLGISGKAFDAAVGHKIAEATADDLLKVVCDAIEREYMLDEPHLSR